MVTKPEILEALQFPFMNFSDPINTTGNAPYTITWQYAGSSQPADFLTDFGSGFSGWANFFESEKAAFEAVLDQIETFLNVDFVEVSGSSDPDLNVGIVTLPSNIGGWGGLSIFASGTTITSWDAFVVFNSGLLLSDEANTNLLLHEMGHALGLDHPFSEAPFLPGDEDSNKYTVMSYTDNPDNGQKSDAMMLYDVYALQDIWGSASFLTGDTTYTGSRTDTIDVVWDTGGTDIFDASASASAVVLDLREGAFSTFGSIQDVVIAYDTEIENATGGSNADLIIGNGLANVLTGNGGNDTILAGGRADQVRGGAGADTLKGQNGNDKLWGNAGNDTLLGQAKNDKLWGGGGRDTLKGGDGEDKLWGGNKRDKLFGGDGDDVLNGQKGNDKLIGNAGADQFVFAKNGDKDTIRDFEDNVDEIRIKGLGTLAEVQALAQQNGADVVFDFGSGDILTVKNATIAQVVDDMLI